MGGGKYSGIVKLGHLSRLGYEIVAARGGGTLPISTTLRKVAKFTIF